MEEGKKKAKQVADLERRQKKALLVADLEKNIKEVFTGSRPEEEDKWKTLFLLAACGPVEAGKKEGLTSSRPLKEGKRGPYW